MQEINLQYIKHLEETITKQTISSKEKDKIIVRQEQQISEQSEVIQGYQQIVQNKDDTIEDLVDELYQHKQLLSNPNLSEREKCTIVAYLYYYYMTPKREDDTFYYNRTAIAESLGGTHKIQSVSPVHKKLEEYRYITTTKEPQKGDKNKTNCFDRLAPHFLSSLATMALDDHSKRGGLRIAIHKECGGVCRERPVYLCEKCGEDYIEAKNVLLITEEEYENREDFNKKLDETVDAIMLYGDNNSDLPDTIVDEIGSVEQAMQASPIQIVQIAKYHDELMDIASLQTKGMYNTYGKKQSPPNNK